MNYRRHGLGALSLCLIAAVTAVVFTAVTAQATVKIGGVGIGESKPEFLGEELSLFYILTLVGGIKVEILCESVKIVEAKIEEPLSGKGTILFTKNCKTFLNLVENTNCKPLDPTVAKAKAKMFLHSGITYILFEPLEGGTFMTKHLGTGTCILGLNFPITGSAVVECLVIACNVEAVTHRASVVLPGLFPNDKLKFGANETTLHGSMNLHLSAPNEGKAWSGVG